jgi:hypothetical protein
MPCVGFESTIPPSERAKTVHALDRWATMTGFIHLKSKYFPGNFFRSQRESPSLTFVQIKWQILTYNSYSALPCFGK